MTEVHSIDELLSGMHELGASDLHVAAHSPPLVRVHGELHPLEDVAPLEADDTQQLLYRILSTEQQKRLEIERQIDMSYAISGVARFRVNVFFQRDAVGAAFRLIPYKILTLEEPRLPNTLHTRGAAGTIDRIIDVFPAEQQGQVRAMLASSLEGVVTQTLLPTSDGQGRVAALEILIPDYAVRNLIRQRKLEQIYSVMQTG